MKVCLQVMVEIPDGAMCNEFHAITDRYVKDTVTEMLQMQLAWHLVPLGSRPECTVVVRWLPPLAAAVFVADESQ